jgi:hypothetical protein
MSLSAETHTEKVCERESATGNDAKKSVTKRRWQSAEHTSATYRNSSRMRRSCTCTSIRNKSRNLNRSKKNNRQRMRFRRWRRDNRVPALVDRKALNLKRCGGYGCRPEHTIMVAPE